MLPMPARLDEQVEVSIVIPVFNAEQTIAVLTDQLIEVFRDRATLQIVLVNDDSTDGTHDICLRLAAEHPNTIAYLRLARNFGEHSAVMAGLHAAFGAYVVIMDDDLQHRPEDACRLFDTARAGDLDLVYSVYPKQAHPWVRILGSRFNGWVANVMLDKPRDLYLSSFKCLSRWLVNEVVKYRGPFPYIDGLALRCTRNIGRVDVAHRRRAAGRSGYTVRKLIRLWLNMCVNFSVVPLRTSAVLGCVLVVCGMVLSGVVIVEKLVGRPTPSGWPFLAIITMLFSGTQLLMLGLMGEYVGRLFLSINDTPQFVIRECRGVRLEQPQETHA